MDKYGIFQSIIEGDQAEAYKKRKQDEMEKSRAAKSEREDRRANADSHSSSLDDALRKSKSDYMTRSHMKKTGRDNFGDYVSGKDATNRHIRRHPELNESTTKSDSDDLPEQFAADNKGHGKGFSPDDMLDESSIVFI